MTARATTHMSGPAQVVRLLEAVKALPGRGSHLHACFGCMYYEPRRAPPKSPSCRGRNADSLPLGGLLNLKGGAVMAGNEWTDGGAVHEIHSLKRRAAKAT